MQFDAGLTGDAAALARGHAAVLTRLPATVHAFILVELHKWGTLFSAEQRYQRALLDHLTDLPQPELVRATAAIARIEAEAGCDRIARGNPARFQDEAQNGYPMLTVPFALVPNAPTAPFPEGFNAKPSPYGVSFVGSACSEPRLIALAYAFEQATKKRVPPSSVP